MFSQFSEIIVADANREHVIEHVIFVVCQTSVSYFSLSLSLSLLLDKRAGPGKRLVGISGESVDGLS